MPASTSNPVASGRSAPAAIRFTTSIARPCPRSAQHTGPRRASAARPHSPAAEVRMHGGLDLALVFLLAAVVAVPVFRRFGLGAVLGYLAAGVVLGPFGLRVVRDADPVLGASEIGVVMLLFVIGLELSPARLRVMRKPVFGVGGLQVLLSGLALGGLAMLTGV